MEDGSRMHQISEPDLEDTLATLDAAIEEFHQIRDSLQLSSTAGVARESAEQEKTAAASLVSTLG